MFNENDAVAIPRFDERSLMGRWRLWVPAVIAAFYPLLLDSFHDKVIDEGHISIVSWMYLSATFLVPVLGMYFAWLSKGVSPLNIRARRIGLLLVTVPTLYCFFGVNTIMVGSKVNDEAIWMPLWILLGFLFLSSQPKKVSTFNLQKVSVSPLLRIGHGVSGLLVTAYVAFHLFNHLFSLFGESAHAQVMEMGRIVYRSSFIEPLLVLALLFQVVTGGLLVWKWSAQRTDFYRLFQLTTGVFLSIFILSHLNAVFIFARTFAGIETDWSFATGDPVGMLYDPWSIRLIPHYAFGVFFVLAHLGSGLRVVMLAHGVYEKRANYMLFSLVFFALLITISIMLGLNGIRL